MPTYWFKPKRYGYGATPVSWQGWVVTGVSLVVVIVASIALVTHSIGGSWLWLAVAIELAALVALVAISRRTTDGEWRWRWGDRN